MQLEMSFTLACGWAATTFGPRWNSHPRARWGADAVVVGRLFGLGLCKRDPSSRPSDLTGAGSSASSRRVCGGPMITAAEASRKRCA